MTKRQRVLHLLGQLGLNELESEVYVFLLGHPPMTAYRVAKQIGKATANTYKAIESLARRGAVLIEEGENRLCRAVPAAEFLQQLQRGFAGLANEAEDALASLGQPTWDERVYKLESVPQVLERCRQMLEERVEKLAIVDAFPASLASVLPAVHAAVARRADVLVQAYKPIEISGAEVTVPMQAPQAQLQWGSQQLNVVIDGREALIALLSDDLTQVFQAVWTNSLYLACILGAGMMAEHTLHRMRAAGQRRGAGRQMLDILERHRFFLNTEVPGQTELLARFVGDRQ